MSWFTRWLRRFDSPLFDGPTDTRPRIGHVEHKDGTHTPLRFADTDEPDVFQAITLTGERAMIRSGEPICMDMIREGQAVEFTFLPGTGEALDMRFKATRTAKSRRGNRR